MGLFDWIAKCFGREKRSPEEVERLRAEFRATSHSFKLLLSANNQALEVMSEIEQALGGGRPFSMSFVRSRCCRTAATVYQVMRELSAIAPNKYEGLYEKFDQIFEEVAPYLSHRAVQEDYPLVVSLTDVDRRDLEQVGNKMANLGEIKRELDIRVPPGFIVTSNGFRAFMEYKDLQTRIDKTIGMMSSDEFDYLFDASELATDLILDASVPPELEMELDRGWAELADDTGALPKVAVRSSSPLEDLPGMSMAGQYRTELNVDRDDFFDAFKKVVASKYNYQSMQSRLELGILDEDVAMCVGVMPMVDAAGGGVIYTDDPVHADENVVTVYATDGLPSGVVDGTGEVDRFLVAKTEKPTVVVKEKERKTRAVFEAEALELAELAKRIESYYGVPQDIEWAVDKDKVIWILQSRPLTRRTHESRAREDEQTRISNIPPIVIGGITASPGVSFGEVVLIRNERDLVGFEEGSVLVAAQALPNYAAVLSKAAAVVTDSGNVAGHLASVSREMGVPALFSVKGATSLLIDGQVVTVDADGACIFPGQVGNFTSAYKPPVSHIEESRVYKSLKQAAEHLVPLTMLDPDSPEFTPSHVKSCHDITRFCHEKAVKNMFRFGAEHTFPEHASRQLFVEVPMQFWVIDLEDGFGPQASEDGKFIRLTNIVSDPMQVLWKGMTAVPWEGPPTVDAAGFMAVMFESTRNPELVASQPSEYSDRNYFMVSKNFVSLQSRFGYHFSSVEAFMGERARENYLSFVFKGGAADLDRRKRRARLVGEVLEEKGIMCRVVEDSANARLENCDAKEIADGLLVVGFLSMHTRQLDMVMRGAASVRKHKEKILEELKKFDI